VKCAVSRSYRLTTPSGIGSIHGAVEINDEVAVILKVKIHAMIEAGEGCIGGSDDKVGAGKPDLSEEAEHRRGAGEKKDRFQKHISGMDFAKWMLPAFALIEETKRTSSIPTSPFILDPLSVRLASLRCNRNSLTRGKLAVGVQKDSTGGDSECIKHNRGLSIET